MSGNRVIAACSLAVLAGLVVAAVVLSQTASAPSRIDPAHLVVGPGVPSTATATLTYSSTYGTTGTAQLTLDGRDDTAAATLTASNGVLQASLQGREVADVLYVDVSAFTSQLGRPWAALTLPRLHRGVDVALEELRHPDLAGLRRLGARTTTSTTGSVTVLRLRRVHFPSLGTLPVGLPSRGNVTITVTTGTSGQVLDVAVKVVSLKGNYSVHAAITITGYNQPVAVNAPPPTESAPLDSTRAQELFGADAAPIDHLLRELGATLRVVGPAR